MPKRQYKRNPLGQFASVSSGKKSGVPKPAKKLGTLAQHSTFVKNRGRRRAASEKLGEINRKAEAAAAVKPRGKGFDTPQSGKLTDPRNRIRRKQKYGF